MRRLVLLALLVAACRTDPQPNGVGPYLFGSTVLADGQATMRCEPSGKTTWCFGGKLKIGEQAADVSLYFDGAEDKSPLVEIAATIRTCDPEATEAALTKAIGSAGEARGKQRVWAGKRMFVRAKLKDGDPSCEINFVDPKDQKRVAELQATP